MKALVISTHPDDETLGCGGTLLKHNDNRGTCYWLIITEPISEKKKESRKKEIENVEKCLNFQQTYELNYPTTKLDEVPRAELIKNISNIINKVEPEIIFLPNRSDVHSDHSIVFQAAYSCTKSFRYPFIKKVLMYETLSETEFAPALPENSFTPNYFVDISEYMEQKIEIMKIYESEVMPDNLPRSISAIRSLAGYRGSRIGVTYAEAFIMLFEKQ